MQVRVYSVTGEICEEWETIDPIEDLVRRTDWQPHKKHFKLDGQAIERPEEQLIPLLLTSKFQTLEVYLMPRGPLFTGAGLILLALTVVTGVLSFLLFRPRLSDRETEQPEKSPVNRYDARLNRSRVNARIPSIYGTHRIYPDLIAPNYWLYNRRIQTVHLLMAVGIGNHDIADVRLGDTPIGQLGIAVRYNLLQPGQPTGQYYGLVVRNVDNFTNVNFIQANQGGRPTQFYTVPGDQVVDMWFDFSFPNGARRIESNGNLAPVVVRISISVQGPENFQIPWAVTLLDEIPTVYTVLMSRLINRRLTPGIYRVSLFQEHIYVNTSETQYISNTVLSRIGGVELPERTIYPDVTTMEVQIDTSQLNQENVSARINFLATRRIRNLQPGGIMTQSLLPTRRMCDALVETATGAAGGDYADAQLDLQGLYEIQQELEAEGEGYFDAVLDQKISVDDEMQQICFIGRVQMYRYGNRIYFSRDSDKPIVSGLFNGRNKIEPEDVVFNFIQRDDPKAIEVQWINPATNYRPAQAIYPPDYQGLDVEKINLVGCTIGYIAERRAIFEYLSFQLRRDRLEMHVTEEARLLGLLDRFQISDGIEELVAEGECEVAGNITYLDREIDARPGDFLHLRNVNGSAIDIVTVISLNSNAEIVCDRAPNVGSLSGYEDAQNRVLFVLKSQNSDVTDWHVTEVRSDNDLGGWIVTGMPYRPSVYTESLAYRQAESIPLNGPG